MISYLETTSVVELCDGVVEGALHRSGVELLEFGQVLHIVGVHLERWVDLPNLAFSDEFVLIEQFEIAEVDEGELVTSEELFAVFFHVVDNRFGVLDDHRSDFLSWLTSVAGPSRSHLEIMDDAVHHLCMSEGHRIVDVEEFWLVLGSDVAHDGSCLGELQITVLEVGQVGEVVAQSELDIQPFCSRKVWGSMLCVLSFVEFDTAVGQFVPDLRGESANVPVAKNWF